MSLAFLTKPIGGSKKAAADPASGPANKTPGPIRGASGPAGSPMVGATPRADLMPPEIRTKRSQLRTRRSLRLVLFAVFLVVVVACGGAWAWNTVAQATLAATQAEEQALLVEQTQYSPVTTVKDGIALIQAGQVVGDSSEIDWQDYLVKLQATLPAGVTLSSVTIDTADPLKAYTQTTVPLQGGRIATLAFTATSPSLPSIPAWLDGLKTLPGYVDATPGQVVLLDGAYTADVTMHIGTDAFSNRFAPAKSATSTGGSTDATTGGN